MRPRGLPSLAVEGEPPMGDVARATAAVALHLAGNRSIAPTAR